ncbi:basic proline-rich protein-like [Peromyscus leucopus]|uniref:basic proline-rich protein-like n=1 Tax=Peromyscus leucopus TaxID=10041 RepID=UPI0010A11936|nr:basic proline-rich protein-like [Peromyscus leucopus]
MVSGHPPPREPEPGTGPALCGPPRPGAAPGLARRLRLHGQGHTARRPPRPPWRRPRRSDRHTRSAVPSPDPASPPRSGPAHGVRPRPAPAGLGLHGAPPTPRPSRARSSRSPAHAPPKTAPSQPLLSTVPGPCSGYTFSQTNPTSEEPSLFISLPPALQPSASMPPEAPDEPAISAGEPSAKTLDLQSEAQNSGVHPQG